MTSEERHERAVAQSLGSAREAADRDDFAEALAWLAMVETIDGQLQSDWELARAAWVDSAAAVAGRRRYAQAGGP